MKKIVIVSALICAMLLSGCSSKKQNSESSGNTTTTSQSSTTESGGTESTTESAKDESENTDASDVNLEELAQIITQSGEWPSMYAPEDTEFEDYFGTSKTDERFGEIYGTFCPMSAILTEVILIKPVGGREQDAQDFLDERKALLIEKYAYYPSDKELAENAKVGSANGIYYLICAQSAESAEAALKEYLG